jgi:hypothetical protein
MLVWSVFGYIQGSRFSCQCFLLHFLGPLIGVDEKAIA